MRKVMVLKQVPHPDKPGRYVFADSHQAVFHDFGVDYEEFETGPGNFSCGIIEDDAGRVQCLHFNYFRFLDKPGADDGH